MNKTFAYIILISLFFGCQSEEISYSNQIKPILNKKCLRCHGGIKKLGGFSLLFEDEALAKTESGNYAIVPGNAQQSELIKRIKHTDPELVMPQEGELLTPQEISLLEKWINQGAKFDEHWSYKPLVKPEIPEQNQKWSDNPIDAFVLAQMTQRELSPSPSAQRSDLMRRLAFDLNGLPLDHNTMFPFFQDTSIKMDRYIDTLLASSHFGEHFASWWLDLARFADSNGYEKDMGRSIWRYRDYVIDAFNRDLPFDSFTLEQLAGDLLPVVGKNQLLGSAYHRNTMTNTEGGTEDEEFRTMAVIDRVNTTFEVWQAATMSCVQCHAHPYDPYRHEDFYKALAYFNNTQDADLDSEYPYLLEHDSVLQVQMLRWASRIQEIRNDNDSQSTDAELSKADVKQLIWPRLFGDFADDFQHVLLSHNGSFNNSSYNANNQKDKEYFLVYEDVAFADIKGIRYLYHSNGSDARIDVYLDNLEADPIASTQMLKPSDNKPTWVENTINPVSGSHDLIFHFVNTSGDFLKGVVNLREIELVGSQSVSATLRNAQDSLLHYYRKGIKTPLMKSKSAILARTTQVFERGNYLVKGDTVEASVPQIFGEGQDVGPSRLALAQWLVGDQNPLTPRVIVNRIWGYIFGRGLVSTQEDFGTQGEPPTHPDLLEYLAYQFANEWQWSIKRLVREIVTSATYQQSSVADSTKLAQDPNNIWYSRANRVRLSAEQIRDQALVVADLLNDAVGGPSVMPPQPDGVWQVVYSSARWEPKDSAEQYRRALYTYWKRTTPYPSMVAFDSPSREFCVSRRITTNTPLQALVTLNDTVYLEAAAHLGHWMSEQSGESLENAIAAGYKKALLKDPRKEDLAILVDLYHSSANPKVKLISFSDDQEKKALAPMTVVANAIMNLDAFLTKS